MPTQEDGSAASPLREETAPAPPGGGANPEPDSGSEESLPPNRRPESQREAVVNSLLTGILGLSLLAGLVMLLRMMKK